MTTKHTLIILVFVMYA